MQMDTQMEKDEDRERLLESEENNHAAHDKVERSSSFEVDEGLQRRHSRKRRVGIFASIDKRYWFAFSLPALLLLIYFTTNLNGWFGSTPDLKVEFPQEQMREAELRALYLLQKQQQGLLHLWSYITMNLTANAATNITPNRSLIATPNPALNTTLNATSPPSLNTTFNNKSPPLANSPNTTFNNKSPTSDEFPNTTFDNKSPTSDESPKTTSKESPNTNSNSPENTTSNVTPSAFSNNVPSNAAFNPSISGAFVTELLSQITLNQEIQQTLLSSHRTGNVSYSEQFDVNTTLNYYGGSTSRCSKAASNNVERKTLKWKPRHYRYLVAICLSGQMSNHLICLEKHMFFAALLNRILVLPSPKFDYHYEHSLDIQHMKDCLGSNTIMTFEEFYDKKRDHLHINRLICYMASPPCYMDDDHVKKFKGIGWSIGKTEVAWPEDAKLKSYPSHPHSEEIVKRFSCNDEVIGIGDVFFADVEEKRVMQPGGPLAHKCKTIVKPNQYILLTAQRFIQTYLGANFIALHFRRYGFLQFCNAKEESCYFPIPQAANCILQKVQTSNAPVIYLSTDAPSSETDLLQSLIVLNGRTVPLVKRPAHDARGKWDALLYRHRLHSDDQVFAMLDKTICALSSVFIGTNGSTFTDDIIRLRRDWGTASTCDEHLCQGTGKNKMGQMCCCIQVDQSKVAMTEKFGRFNDVLEPGCHCLPWIFGYKVAGHLSLRVQKLDVRCETKTKDNVFVTVIASVQYRAILNKAMDAFYKLSNTREQIQAYVFDVIRSSVPKMNLDEFFEQKNDVARAVEEELEKVMTNYGFEIVQTLIVDIEPVETVKRAMNEINAAARMRVATNDKAEAEKILQIKRAEGEAEAKYLSGLGIARQRQAIVDGLRDSVLAFSDNVPGTTAREVMDMVLVTQYFDTMKEIGASSKSSAVFIPHGPGAVRDVAEEIRNGLLQAQAL